MEDPHSFAGGQADSTSTVASMYPETSHFNAAPTHHEHHEPLGDDPKTCGWISSVEILRIVKTVPCAVVTACDLTSSPGLAEVRVAKTPHSLP